jgi:hypothetical protein
MIRDIFRLNRLKQNRTCHTPAIRMRWVETADERCPLACTWSPILDQFDEQEEEPGLFSSLISIKIKGALHTLFMHFSHHHDGFNISLLKVQCDA